MSNYTLIEAKNDFKRGYLKKATIIIQPSNTYFVSLGDGDCIGMLVDSRSKQPRKFKSLDSAYSVLRSIGFVHHSIFLFV